MGTPNSTGFRSPVVQNANFFTSLDDSILYTPETDHSPETEQYRRYPRRHNVLSSHASVADTQAQTPMIDGQAQWMPSSAPPDVLPPNMFEEGSYVNDNLSMAPPDISGKHENNDFKQLSWELANDLEDIVMLLTNVSKEELERGADGKVEWVMFDAVNEVMRGEAQAEVAG